MEKEEIIEAEDCVKDIMLGYRKCEYDYDEEEEDEEPMD